MARPCLGAVSGRNCFLSSKVHCTEVNVDLFLDKRLVIMVAQDVMANVALLSCIIG